MFISNLSCLFRNKHNKINPINQTKIHVWENNKKIKTVPLETTNKPKKTGKKYMTKN